MTEGIRLPPEVWVWPAKYWVPEGLDSQAWYDRVKAVIRNMDLRNYGAAADRPDPLAPPEGYGEPQEEPGPDLSACAGNGTTCPNEPQYVTWIGCVHEHVGPVADCEQHARQLASLLSMLVCGICGSPMQILRTEPEPPLAAGMTELLDRIVDGKPCTK